jgi:hypothetical protein
MPKLICFKFFCTVKREFVVPAIIFLSASLKTIHASKCCSHAIWTVENELVVLSRCHRCCLDRIYGAYTAWKMFKWGYLSHRVTSVSAIVDNNGNRVNPACIFKELRKILKEKYWNCFFEVYDWETAIHDTMSQLLWYGDW